MFLSVISLNYIWARESRWCCWSDSIYDYQYFNNTRHPCALRARFGTRSAAVLSRLFLSCMVIFHYLYAALTQCETYFNYFFPISSWVPLILWLALAYLFHINLTWKKAYWNVCDEAPLPRPHSGTRLFHTRHRRPIIRWWEANFWHVIPPWNIMGIYLKKCINKHEIRIKIKHPDAENVCQNLTINNVLF